MTRAADFDNGYDAFSLDNLRSTSRIEPGRDQHKMVAHGATWQQPLGSLELEAQLNHVSSELLYGYDEDWAYPEIHPLATHPPMNMPEIETAAVLHCRYHPLGKQIATPYSGRAVFTLPTKVWR